MNAPSDLGVKQSKWPTFSDVLGPGLITGASDDDPSGIATYSQAGAQFGYSLGWTLLFTYPLTCAIQLISAQIGRVTGRGLAGNIRHCFPAWLLYPLVGLLIIANTINLGADPAQWPRRFTFSSTVPSLSTSLGSRSSPY